MAAINFINEIEARSAREGYEILVEAADIEHGNRSYNGSINTCSMGRKMLSFPTYLKTNEKKAYSFINDKDNGSKWEADYIDLGVVRYDVYTFKKINIGKPPEYKFVAEIKSEVKSYKTKPKLKSIENRVIIPIHKYLFYGWASY